MDACSTGLLQWAGWITAIALGISGYAFTAFGWRVRGQQAKLLAKKKDIHDTIDRALAALIHFEDAAYSFWSDSNSSIRSEQLTLLHKRCVHCLNQLQQLESFTMPVQEIVAMRRQATLDAESRTEPLKRGHPRLKMLSRAVENIMTSKPLRKSWN